MITKGIMPETPANSQQAQRAEPDNLLRGFAGAGTRQDRGDHSGRYLLFLKGVEQRPMNGLMDKVLSAEDRGLSKTISPIKALGDDKKNSALSTFFIKEEMDNQ
ncbi:MAG: hypothetical protein ACOYOS_14565 [Syntrophales bacterium]